MSKEEKPRIVIAKDGPYLVAGPVPLQLEIIETDEGGNSVGWKTGREFAPADSYALCRCGRSAMKPFCDGTHAKIGFDGRASAAPAAYDEIARVIKGPSLALADAKSLCAFARFCDADGSVWNLIRRRDNPTARDAAIKEAERCPSGRLVMRDADREYEPSFPPSIGLVQDPAKSCSGPIWVRGGIPVVAEDGTAYPVRNRQTLCRCGQSQNKPFCDGAHVGAQFADGL